ncbi:peroxiredoxin [Tannerella sp.]|uniref:peroxiredoxin family protein n=1 Tax=Tannerella sp. TaxID=2382127 RepID=UPI0026DDA9F5|nr:redoxin domain-containing protein [Tannerella sp.]MDO4703634.1 redoxin domain-containing protein [Tannerella sp.]
MKRIYIIIVLLSVFVAAGIAQEITEENYLKLDKEIWEAYERQNDSIYALMKREPDRKEALKHEFEKNLEDAQRRNAQAALRFASVPSGLQRLFWVRLHLPKDTVEAVWNRLPDEIKTSPYGKSIRMHLDTQQIEEGARYADFEATAADGRPFRLSSLEGKYIVLLYDGLGCMGEEGRNELKQLYESTSRDDLEIVVYCISSSLEQLREDYVEKMNLPFTLVSDFKMDHTPFKIIYGTQARPTVFVIDPTGTVVLKTIGVNPRDLNNIKLKLQQP